MKAEQTDLSTEIKKLGLQPEDVFTDGELVKWVANKQPAELFTFSQLKEAVQDAIDERMDYD